MAHSRLILVAALAGAAVLAFLLWNRREVPAPAPSMVTAFQRMNELTVFRAQVVAVPTTRADGLFDALDREQTDIVGANVRYTIDLSRLTEEDVRWDEATRTATVVVPPVTVQPAELEGTSRRTFRTGPPAAAATWDGFARSNAGKARAEAGRLARAPELMRLAEASARDAIAANARPFLHAAKGPDARVEVRFATERRTGERVDGSTPLDAALSQRR